MPVDIRRNVALLTAVNARVNELSRAIAIVLLDKDVVASDLGVVVERCYPCDPHTIADDHNGDR